MEVPRMMENRDSREGEQKRRRRRIKNEKKETENPKQFTRRHMSTVLQANPRNTEK